MEKQKISWSLPILGKLLKDSFNRLQQNDPLRMAGATAFFTMFALPPILIILVQFFSLFIDPQTIRHELFVSLSDIFGQEAVRQIISVIRAVKKLSYKKIFWQGFFTNVLNPKVALFFLAFLPQFIDIAKQNTGWQILFLGTWFDAGGTLVNIVVALLFGKIGEWLNRSAAFVQWQQRIIGTLLIALGIKVALSSKK